MAGFSTALESSNRLRELPSVDWEFSGCGLIPELSFLLPGVSLLAAAAALPLSVTGTGNAASEAVPCAAWRVQATPLLLAAGAGPGPAPSLAGSPWPGALRGRPGHCCSPCPVRLSAEAKGRFAHVPWGAAEPIPAQSAALSGGRAFPEEGEERNWAVSLAGKANWSAASSTALLSRRCWGQPGGSPYSTSASAGVHHNVYRWGKVWTAVMIMEVPGFYWIHNLLGTMQSRSLFP